MTERLKQHALVGSVDTDPGILHCETQPGRPIVPRIDGTHTDLDKPLLGEFQGVAAQIDQNLQQLRLIALHITGQARGDSHIEPQPLGRGGHLEHIGDLLHQIGQCKRLPVELILAGFQFGVTEDVIDQLQQQARGRRHLGQILALAGAQLHRQHQIGEPDHRIQGCAQLMSDYCKELAFGPVGTLRLLLGPTQLPGALAHAGFQFAGKIPGRPGPLLQTGNRQIQQCATHQRSETSSPSAFNPRE